MARPTSFPKKEGEAARPEPPGEVLAEALKILRADRRGRWHVRAPEIARHREGLYAWAISDSEVKRLLRLLWPKYVVRGSVWPIACTGGR